MLNAALLASTLASCQAPAPPGALAPLEEPLELSLEITVDDPGSGRVRLEARLAGLDGPVALGFVERYAYATPEPRLTGAVLAADPATGESLALERRGPFRWSLDPGGATRAHLAWEIVLDHRGLPEISGGGEYEHPYLETDHGLLVTGALALVPLEVDFEPEVRFSLPEGWALHAPWPEIAPGVHRPGPQALVDELVAIGDWVTEAGSAGGLEYTLAFAPGQAVLADLVRPRVGPIVETEVGLFGDAPQPRYLFVFGRPDRAMGYGGSPKANSMALFVSPDLPPDFAADGVTHLIAHEYHHTWMKARCQPVDDLRFVVEGYTDYYAHVAPWLAGLNGGEALRTSLAQQLGRAEVAMADFGGTLTEAGGPAFFEGGSAYESCYAAGLAIALAVDLRLRRDGFGGGLDEHLRRFYEDPRWRDGTRPALAHYLARLRDDAGETFAARIERAVARRGGPDWVALFEAAGAALERTIAPVPDGPLANFDGTVLTALDPAGPGARIGLRAGDRLLEVNGRVIESAADAYAAWDETLDGELVVVYERGGERRRHVGPPVTEPRYTLPTDLVDRLARE